MLAKFISELLLRIETYKIVLDFDYKVKFFEPKYIVIISIKTRKIVWTLVKVFSLLTQGQIWLNRTYSDLLVPSPVTGM
jgi:hypothetical protein